MPTAPLDYTNLWQFIYHGTIGMLHFSESDSYDHWFQFWGKTRAYYCIIISNISDYSTFLL